MPLKPGARPPRALPLGAQSHLSGPIRNNGWVALSVLPNGGAKRRLSRAGRTGPWIPPESIRLSQFGAGCADGRREPASHRPAATAQVIARNPTPGRKSAKD